MPIVSDVKEVDVVVVGAGITGLSTAYAVQKMGRSVLVVESFDDVGGRIMTRERTGQTFVLFDAVDEQWLQWAPKISLKEAAQSA